MKLKGISKEGMQRLAKKVKAQGDLEEVAPGLAEDDDVNARIQALADFLGVSPDEIEQAGYGDNDFETPDGEYLVLTDEEADAEVAAYIEDSLWAFNANFIIEHTNLPPEAEEMIKAFQESKYEDANPTIRALIPDFDAFVEAAIMADGRGHFLSQYDSEEGESGNFYIYRTN